MNTSKNSITNYIHTHLVSAIQFFASLYATIANTNNININTPRSGVTDIRMVVYIIVAFLIAAILFPIAMAQVTAATTTSWGQGVAPVFVSLLPILVIIAIALHFFGIY